MSRAGRVAGKISGEIIQVPIDLFSLRLINGDFIGPKLYVGVDNKLHRVEGSEGAPLAYTPEVLSLLEKHSWNVRKDYGIESGELEDLKLKIRARGGVTEPIKAILDGNYLAPKDGHRRHLSVWQLNQEGCNILTIPTIITTIGHGTSWETEELDMWGDGKKNLNPVEKSSLIQRFINRGYSKEQFMEAVGITSNEYDTLMMVAGQPSNVQNLLIKGDIAVTTLRNAIAESKRLEWTSAQFAAGIIQAVEQAKGEGYVKASERYIKEYFHTLKEPPSLTLPPTEVTEVIVKPQLPNEQTTSSPSPPPRAKPKTGLKVNALKKLIDLKPLPAMEGFVEITEELEGHILLPIPEDMWDEILQLYEARREKKK
ncbi:hypothetical protein H6G33_09975 [Calothrix sp. FACHB-1219]|uniref:hypothetical protein n=1 Tax=unclassified Calothrix TaxID=2619626 RepID=UPI001686881C|nr:MULTISPECIES: hypothetical protein [unclassified Calothrix]MBD2201674.1 hypothetical protein [Calothrix sp. FACHB-168]MBD2217360.1 hypothetical protein [Calothrix sp. FACHB-1219]